MQLPEWFTRPESIFRLVLWLVGPFFTWWVGRTILRRYEAWNAALTESNARITLAYLYKALDNPPTLLESLAFIICFLPIPILIVALCFTLYFSPRVPYWMLPTSPMHPKTADALLQTIAFIVSFCCYVIFSILTIQGVKTAYHLRHGQARFHANYKAGVQKKIDKLLKKFPQLRSDRPSESA